MKKIKSKLYFLTLSLLFWGFSSCTEGTDFNIDRTPISPIGGEYIVTITRGYDLTQTDEEFWASSPNNVEEVGTIHAYLSNTTTLDKDSAWIRVGLYNQNDPYNINAKVYIDMSSYKFNSSSINNYGGNSATPTDYVTVAGFCTHNEYTTPSGSITDYITLTYSRTSAPGYHFKAEGWKYTGWSEDN